MVAAAVAFSAIDTEAVVPLSPTLSWKLALTVGKAVALLYNFRCHRASPFFAKPLKSMSMSKSKGKRERKRKAIC